MAHKREKTGQVASWGRSISAPPACHTQCSTSAAWWAMLLLFLYVVPSSTRCYMRLCCMGLARMPLRCRDRNLSGCPAGHHVLQVPEPYVLLHIRYATDPLGSPALDSTRDTGHSKHPLVYPSGLYDIGKLSMQCLHISGGAQSNNIVPGQCCPCGLLIRNRKCKQEGAITMSASIILQPKWRGPGTGQDACAALIITLMMSTLACLRNPSVDHRKPGGVLCIAPCSRRQALRCVSSGQPMYVHAGLCHALPEAQSP